MHPIIFHHAGEVEFVWGKLTGEVEGERKDDSGKEKSKDGNWVHTEEEIEKERTNEIDDNVYSAEKLSGKKEQKEVEVERSGQVVESLEKMERL